MKRAVSLIALMVLVACGRSAPAPAPAPPMPVATPAPETPLSIDEVRALKTAGKLDQYEHQLQLLSSVATDPVARGRAEALLALFYLEQNQRDKAVPFLERAATDDPMVAPWMWLRIDDIPSVNRVIQQGSDTTAGALARLRITSLYAVAGNALATNGAFAWIETLPIDETNEEAFVDVARTLAKTGRTDLSSRLQMRLLREYPQGRFTEENYAAVAKLTPSPLDALLADEALEIAAKLGRSEHYDEALDLLQRIAKNSPTQAATNEYRDLRLRSLFHSRHYEQLLSETDEKSLRDPAMRLVRARAAWRADKPQDFLAALKRIEREFPRTPAATDAKILRAKYYTVDEPKLDLAITNLKEAIAAGAYGTDGEILWTLGWTYYLANRFDDALATFADYAKRYPDGDYLTNALFWSGKIYDRQGRTAERDAAFDRLESLYPYNYFSYRARELRHQPAIAPSDIANGNVFPDVDAELAKTKTYDQSRLDLISELDWLGLYRDAISNIKLMEVGYPDNAAVALMLADAYVKAGEPLRANSTLQRHFRQFIRHGGTGIPRRLWEILYPLAYWDVIQREAAKANVDPFLLASIARQESIFEPKTVSNAGAVGVMQIMPQEAARIAEAAGLQPPTREQLFDPTINIAIGAAEYAQKRTAMNGNDILAIAAYNAGTDAVGRWLAATPVNDGDLFVESIPFNETRLYVKTVTRNRFEYRRIYENGGSSSQQSK